MKRISLTNYGLSAFFVFCASCATEPATGNTGQLELRRGATSLDPPAPPDLSDPVLAPQAIAPGAKLVGYYDMSFGIGLGYEVPPITTAGGTAIAIDDPSAAELANLNVLTVTNPDNGGYGFGYVNRLSDIAAAVQNGMVLVIHDRAVSGAQNILPAGAAFDIVRDFTEGSDINIHDGSTVVTAGLDDTSLDGGLFSSHGFAVDTSLPPGAKLILSATTSSHIVTFCYSVGKGAVIYSTIPLDFYLQGLSGAPVGFNLANIYAPNVVTYALAGACANAGGGGPRPTPN
jgi:large repetitive protein